MDRTAFTAYTAKRNSSAVPVLHADEVPGPDRTLTLGPDGNGMVRHIYLADGMLHAVEYHARRGMRAEYVHGDRLPLSYLTPATARPECTDETFALLMRERGSALRFSPFSDQAPASTSAGPLWLGLRAEETRLD